MKPFPGAPAPAPGLDQPLEMLAACHERIESQLRTLERLASHLAAHGIDGAAAEAARAVMHYFDTAGVDHHADEEEDLFALLRACGPAGTGALLDRLRVEHDRMRSAWAELRPGLLSIASREGAGLDWARVRAFASLYRKHIALEEAELLPLAGRILEPGDLATLSACMVRRRNSSS